jgi:hypothetical protein
MIVEEELPRFFGTNPGSDGLGSWQFGIARKWRFSFCIRGAEMTYPNHTNSSF